ncbi:MAG TPA: hypothetical protein VLD86_05515 [Ilumatobacteraceae bacterium]|nr:hypothetical protein [Ilumatobacteraceae bacterium]
MSFAAADEARHRDVAVEAWWWWGWNTDATSGAFVGFELRGRRFDYWAGLVRADEPYLYVEELDGEGLRDGLEIKPPEMWAGHSCDVPFRQWSVANEAHGVLLDDPTEAWRRAHGTPVPVTFDIEWGATGDAAPIEHGYEQAGEIDARIELTEGVLELVGPGHRLHVWGVPYLPRALAMPATARLRGPYRRGDGVNVDQVLTSTGWLGRVSA